MGVFHLFKICLLCWEFHMTILKFWFWKIKLTFHLACHLNSWDFSFPFVFVDVCIYLLYSFNNIDQVGLRVRWGLHSLGVTIKVIFRLYKMYRDFLPMNLHLDDISEGKMGVKYLKFLPQFLQLENWSNLHKIFEFIKTGGSIHNWHFLILLTYCGLFYTEVC